jgi:hypothetical protein
MVKTAEYMLEDGSTVSIVIDPNLEEAVPASGEGIEPKLRESIDKIGKILPDIRLSLIDIMDKISANEITIDFGVALSSNGSIIIASTGIQASFNVSVTWNKSRQG